MELKDKSTNNNIIKSGMASQCSKLRT